MISRRTFLKRLGQATILAMADPLILCQSVKPTDPVEDVLGLILDGPLTFDDLTKITNSYFRKPIIIPGKEFDLLEFKLHPDKRLMNRKLAEQGYISLMIKGTPIVRGK